MAKKKRSADEDLRLIMDDDMSGFYNHPVNPRLITQLKVYAGLWLLFGTISGLLSRGASISTGLICLTFAIITGKTIAKVVEKWKPDDRNTLKLAASAMTAFSGISFTSFLIDFRMLGITSALMAAASFVMMVVMGVLLFNDWVNEGE